MQTEADGLTPETLATLVKRQTHDLRNALNGIELDLTLMTETTNEAERRAASKRIRQQLRCTEGIIRAFTPKFIREGKTAVCVADVVQQWISDVRVQLPDSSVEWDLIPGGHSFHAEAKLLRSILIDLTIQAARETPSNSIVAHCRCDSGQVVFSLALNRDPDDVKRAATREPPHRELFHGLASRCGGSLELPQSPELVPVVWRLRFAMIV